VKIAKKFVFGLSLRGLNKHAKWAPVLGLAIGFGLTIAQPVQASSFWNSSTVPGLPAAANDGGAVTLGLQFRSDVAGTVTGIRFYKGSSNTGTHTGILWSATGTKLASVTFTNETASGWQQANFPAAVGNAANTTYVVSYQAPRGNYADDLNYKWSALSAAPLHVYGTAPGVFAYGATPAFPNQNWNGSNYYVDVVFAPSGTSGATYSITGKITGAAATVNLSGAASASVKTDASGNFTFTGLANGTYLVAPSQSGYSFNPATASVKVNGANVTGVSFTASQSVSHNVSLSWTASTSSGIAGYKVYRAGVSGGPYSLVSSVVTSTTFVDANVVAGDTYYYVTTAVTSGGVESGYSNQASAVIPAP
jgi:hypothetical protein